MAKKQASEIELNRARTAMVKLRAERDAMVIALHKGQLIAKQDALMSLGFLLTSFRRRALAFPYGLPRRLVGKDEYEIGEILRGACASLLSDLAAWPARTVDREWGLDEIDEDLRPGLNTGNGDDEDGGKARRESVNAQRERRNAQRREKYAKAKEG